MRHGGERGLYSGRGIESYGRNQAADERLLGDVDRHQHPADVLRPGQPYLRRIRGNRASIIFQDPLSSLDPLMTVGEQLLEGILAHRVLTVLQAGLKTREHAEFVARLGRRRM